MLYIYGLILSPTGPSLALEHRGGQRLVRQDQHGSRRHRACAVPYCRATATEETRRRHHAHGITCHRGYVRNQRHTAAVVLTHLRPRPASHRPRLAIFDRGSASVYGSASKKAAVTAEQIREFVRWLIAAGRGALASRTS